MTVLPIFPGVNNLARTDVANTFTQQQTVKANVYVQLDQASNVAPELHFQALSSEWLIGVDIANNGGAKDFVLCAEKRGGSTNDLIYVAQNSPNSPTIGLGVTPPDGSYRVQVSPADAVAGMGGLSIRRGPGQTGHCFEIHDSNPTAKRWIDKDYAFCGADGQGLLVKGDAANGVPLALTKNDGTTVYSFIYSGNSLAFKYTSGGVTVWQADTSGVLRIKAGLRMDQAGFFQTTVGAAGAASALPATPTKYLQIIDNGGTTYVVPCYAAS